MKKLLFSSLLFTVSTSFLLASHLLGGELKLWTDTTGGTNSIMIELRLIRDANGINLTNTQVVEILENGTLSGNTTLTLDPTTGLGNLISIPNVSIPVELYVYTGVFVPQSLTSDISVSFSTCCRPASIDNMGNPASQSYYIYAELDLTQGFNSELPNIAPLAAYANMGVPFVFSNFTQDADGDSLYFALDTPLVMSATYAPQYFYPFNLNNPSPPNFTINPMNGLVSGFPNYVGVSAYRIVIEEYRKDALGNFQLLAVHNKDLAVISIPGSSSSAFVLNPISGSTTLPNGATQVAFIGSQNNVLTLSFDSISTQDFEIEVYGGPFDFDSQNTSITKDSISATACNFELAWNPSLQYVNGGPYYFIVRTKHYGFTYDLLMAIAVNTAVGEEEMSISTFRVFPNPSSDFINIQSEYPIDRVEILDLKGVVVLASNVNPETIDVSSLRSGLYLIKVYQGETTRLQRFVKQ